MRTVLQNLASVIGGEAAVRAANFAAVLYIARIYGKTTLGAYAACLAVVTVVVMFADNGLQTAAITQTTSAAPNRNRIIGQLTISKTVLLLLAMTLLAAIAAKTEKDMLFLMIGAWVTARTTLQSYSQLQMAVLKAVSLARWIGIVQFLHSCILFVGIWLCFQRSWDIFVLLAWLTGGQLLELLFGAAILFRNHIWPGWPARFSFLRTMRMAAPVGIAYGLANLIVRLDTIVLSALVPLGEVGAFSAANTILVIVYVCAWLFGSILLPEMVRFSNEPEKVKQYANRWARWVVLITVPGAILASIAAPKLIVALYGPAFAAAGVLGSIMVLACPLILLNSIYTTLSIAGNRRAAFLTIYGAAALATLVLDFMLGRTFASMGIALAIVVREAGMLLGFWLWTSRQASPATGLELQISSGGN